MNDMYGIALLSKKRSKKELTGRLSFLVGLNR
jgi:hypothetical protein